MIPERVVRRVLSKWVLDGDCWISTYSTGSHGYAQVGWTEGDVTRMTLAHRVAWFAYTGSIPVWPMTVDHLCRRKKCINPAHLRVIHNAQNSSDNGMKARAINPPSGTVCKRGHPKVQPPRGFAYCRVCKAEGKRRKRARTAQERSWR